MQYLLLYCHFTLNDEIIVLLITYCNIGECMKHLASYACFNFSQQRHMDFMVTWLCVLCTLVTEF